MVSSIRRVLLVMMAAVIGLAGCDTSSPSSTGGAGANAASALTLEQAEQIAETFLKSWEKADYTTMYGLISPNSRDAYTRIYASVCSWPGWFLAPGLFYTQK